MTTIREVAQRAGVSYTTVSHVINETRFVSEETRDRVLKSMEELGYRPNALARSLRQGTTHTIGLILPDSANPFFAEVGRSIEFTAFQAGYNVILCNTEGDLDREKIYVDVLLQKQVDGIIFFATGDQSDSLKYLIQREIPVVMVDRELPELSIDAVLTDNQQGGYQATRHLIEMGYQRIACITGPSNLTPTADRVIGFRKALEDANLPVDETLIFRGDFHPDSGKAAAMKFLNQQFPPNAIFACNDLMAIGALRAAADCGFQVPRDLGIVGFDDIELASFASPSLTTIEQRKGEIGMQAVKLLMERIADKSLPPRRVVIPTNFVLRESSRLDGYRI